MWLRIGLVALTLAALLAVVWLVTGGGSTRGGATLDTMPNTGELRLPHGTPTTMPATQSLPSPELPPGEVVHVVLSALQDSDKPEPYSGAATAFAFASPANRAFTGPFPRFVGLVYSPAYRPMINSRSFEVSRARLSGTWAVALAKVTPEPDIGEEPAWFLFQLFRQPGGPLDQCWLTEGVTPLTAEQAARWQQSNELLPEP
jgi:hypothetical protein